MKNLLFSIFIQFLIAGLCNVSHADEIILICNKDNPENSIDSEWIRNVYVGNITKWGNNDKITITIMKDKSLHKTFLKQYVKRSPSQFKAVWKTKLFTGKAKMPTEIKTAGEMIDFIVNNEGAIGYVRSDTNTDKVKTLFGK